MRKGNGFNWLMVMSSDGLCVTGVSLQVIVPAS